MTDSKQQRYRAVVGMNYQDQRFEAGDIITNELPEKSLPWLLKGGHIEPIKEKGKKKPEVTE